MSQRLAAFDVHEGVRAVFNRVAHTPTARFRFGVGASLAREIGYSEAVITGLPAGVTESFTGLADLHPHLRLRPGEHVLDLGSGAGLDAIVAARAVSPGGTVTGLDMAEAMVAKARRAAELTDTRNVSFERGDAESMPFTSESFDAALVNGIFNLCPDKSVVARELARVLCPGGRAVVAEITFREPLPPADVQSIDDWFR